MGEVIAEWWNMAAAPIRDWLQTTLLVSIFVTLLICARQLSKMRSGPADSPGIGALRQGQVELRQVTATIFKRMDEQQSVLEKLAEDAIHVSALRKIFTTSVLTGKVGEIQLETLLRQTVPQKLWNTQTPVKPDSKEKVDFVILVSGAPGSGAEPLWLPIDSKFRLKAYQNLRDAQQNLDDQNGNEEKFHNELATAIRQEAKSIHDKYIVHGKTTEFAVMYLPHEEIFLEVLRCHPNFVVDLQSEYKVTLTGPTTMLAFLNSLYMGLRHTHEIQKQSAEIRKRLTEKLKEAIKISEVHEEPEEKEKE